MKEKFKAVIVGHAIGDAIGVPVEFVSRKELKLHPVTTMTGHGTYPMPRGAWSDDTSMSLCALDAFGADKLNFDKVMINFARWYYNDDFTPTGEMFDVGNTCSCAIERYAKDQMSWKECGLSDENSNGNGSLMRIHPFVLYTFLLDTNTKTKVEIIELASALTHAHKRSKMACGIYAFVLWEILSSNSCINHQGIVRCGLKKARDYYKNSIEFSHFERMYKNLNVDGNVDRLVVEQDIISDGYVVNTLEASLWCLITTNTYSDCVLKAVNLGDDTDTTAAIAGGLAGAVYGYNVIPQQWKNDLIKLDYIEQLCDRALGNRLGK